MGTQSARIARVVQQLRSMSELHARELDSLAKELDGAGAAELASKLRMFRGMHADEVQVAIQELEDLGEAEPISESRTPEESPKRARWLQEEDEQQAQPQPLTRRELLNLGGETEPD